jgi:hypothetical protein
MIDPQDRQKLDALMAQVECPKSFICIHSGLADLCRGEYHRDIDVLECLERGAAPCRFAKPFGCTVVCTCPVRKFIGQNLERWSAEDTAVLRACGG